MQRWEHEESRQFADFPFTRTTTHLVCVTHQEKYMLWGRALSDGLLYPIPPKWYVMRLAFHPVYPPEGNPSFTWIYTISDWASGCV